MDVGGPAGHVFGDAAEHAGGHGTRLPVQQLVQRPVEQLGDDQPVRGGRHAVERRDVLEEAAQGKEGVISLAYSKGRHPWEGTSICVCLRRTWSVCEGHKLIRDRWLYYRTGCRSLPRMRHSLTNSSTWRRVPCLSFFTATLCPAHRPLYTMPAHRTQPARKHVRPPAHQGLQVEAA